MAPRRALTALAALVAVTTLTSAAACRPGTPQECNGTTPTSTAPLVVCPTATTTDVPPPPRTVLVVGDSITAQSESEIHDALTGVDLVPIVAGYAGHSALDTAITGRPTFGMVLDDFVDEDPDIVILEAGTNDVNTISAGGATVADFVSRMVAFRDLFPDACVAVTTVTTHRTSSGFNATARSMNAGLAESFLRVVPWDETEWALREAGTMILQEDLIHPLPAGREVLAQLDVEAALACP